MAELRLTVAAVAAAIAAASGATVADAAPAALVQAPAGWHADPARASDVVHAADLHDGVTAVEAYVPDGGDHAAVLFATRTVAQGSGDAHAVTDAVTDAVIDAFHGEIRADRLTSSTVVEDRFDSHVEGGDTIAELASHDPAIHIARAARLVARTIAGQVVAVTGECLLRDDAAPTVAAACKAALLTLSPGAAGSGAAAVAPVPEPDPTVPPPAMPSPSVMRPLDSTRDVPMMPAIEVPPAEPAERWRPLVFGAGLALLAGLFWVNRKRRHDLAASAGGRDASDGDADALRAAARGDGKDGNDGKDDDGGEKPEP